MTSTTFEVDIDKKLRQMRLQELKEMEARKKALEAE
jgi:hypothetical protein